MKKVEPTQEMLEQMRASIEKAKEVIEAYKSDSNEAKLREGLCKVIDEAPNLYLFESDVLESFGIEAEDDKEWYILGEKADLESRGDLKGIIKELNLSYCALSFESSGSLLYTIFGEAYDYLR